MKIQLYTISKPLAQTPLEAHYIKLCRGIGVEIEQRYIFSSHITHAQKQGKSHAKASYTYALSPFLLPQKHANIALHPEGKSLDSKGFAQLFTQHARMAVFIGGAWGFEEQFLRSTLPISLSSLTFSHVIISIIVLEQIYRAYSMLANHPYHK